MDGYSGLNESGQGSILIYPNPAGGEVAIEMPGEFGLDLYNNLGQLVYEARATDGTKIETSLFARGSYHVRITKGNALFYRKLLLE